jgi:hypothetical protein
MPDMGGFAGEEEPVYVLFNQIGNVIFGSLGDVLYPPTREIVYDNHLVAPFQKGSGQVGADEAGSPGY